MARNMLSAPLPIARLASLAFLFAWAVVGGSVGLNALIKTNQEKTKLNQLAPVATIMMIDTSDIFDSGVVLTTVCALLAVLAIVFAIPWPRPFLLTKAAILLFVSTWLFATLIPFDHFFATGQAGISATLMGIPLPPSVIQGVEQALGDTPVYRHIDYLRLPAILPWFAVLAAWISVAVHIVAGVSSRRADTGSLSRWGEKNDPEMNVVAAQ